MLMYIAPSQTFGGWEDLCISEGACAPLLPGDTQEVTMALLLPGATVVVRYSP